MKTMRTIAQITADLAAHDTIEITDNNDDQWFAEDDALISELSSAEVQLVAAEKRYSAALADKDNEGFTNECVDYENASHVKDQNTVEFWEAMLSSLKAGVEIRKEEA